MGGNVLLQTARPTQEFGGDIQATYGNYNDREINANINIPLVSDVLLTRFAFTGQWRDGYTHILAEPAHPDGVDSDNRDTWSVRGTVVFRPNDSIQNDTIATYSRYDSVASPAILAALFPNAPDGVPALYAQQQALGVRTSLPIDVNDISDGSNLAIDNITRIEIADGLTFRNIFGDAYTYQWLELDQGGIPLPIFDFPLGGGQPPQPNFWGHARQLSEEAQLQGKALADSLDWVAGAFYLDTVPPDFVLQTANVFGVDSSQQLYKDGGISRAIFAQGTYQVIPRVKITGGIRYTKDVRTNVQRGAVSDSVCYGAVLADCGPATELRFVSRAHAITWTGALDYQVTQDTLTYFTSRRGYRAGGFNIGNVLTGNSNPPGFGPEFVTDYELGLKSDWKLAGMPIRTNADLWYQDYTDIQVTTLDPVYGNLTRNAAAARFWGAELEAQANLTQDLQLGVNFNYLNRRYTHFDSTAVGTADLIASETLYNPPYKYGVDLRYHLPLGSEVGDVSARANWSWQSTGGDTLVPLETIKAYGLLNMSADWKGVFGSSLDVSLFATNVLNKLYVFSPGLSFQPGAFGFGTDVYGEPRMYGVRLRYRFGAEAR
jgi:iron complex outermembrane receptor protein